MMMMTMKGAHARWHLSNNEKKTRPKQRKWPACLHCGMTKSKWWCVSRSAAQKCTFNSSADPNSQLRVAPF